MKATLKLAIQEKVLVQIFKKNHSITFFDIGSCEGLSSIRYLEIFTNATSYAFEPVPSNFEKILKNKDKFQATNLHAYCLGLSSQKGTATFYLSSGEPPNKEVPTDQSSDFGNKSSSLYKPGKTKEIHPWLEFNETISIETETLENFCKDHEIETIDFIHMDVQGAELIVLEGAENMISNINSIWLEVEKVPLYENQALKPQIETFLLSNNFICVINKVNNIAGDQFWIKKSFFDSLDNNTKLQLQFICYKSNLKSAFSSFFGHIKQEIKKLKA